MNEQEISEKLSSHVDGPLTLLIKAEDRKTKQYSGILVGPQDGMVRIVHHNGVGYVSSFLSAADITAIMDNLGGLVIEAGTIALQRDAGRDVQEYVDRLEEARHYQPC